MKKKRGKQSLQPHTLVNKVRSLHIIFVVFALILVVFASRWQLIDAAKFDLRAKSRLQERPLTSMKGSIFSKDGTTLAYTEPVVKLSIWLPDLEFYKNQTREELLSKVAPIIGKEPATLIAEVSQLESNGIKNIVLANDLTKEKWEEVKSLTKDANPNLKLQGFSYEFLPKRVYPEGRLASHLLGLTNTYKSVLIGGAGIERRYSDILKPVDGLISHEIDARGSTITSSLLETIEPKNGSDIYITIDKKLQSVIERMIKEGVEKYAADSGSVVIQNPKNGEILALANFPDYDPNIREESDPKVYGNSSITSPYETGSIGKILTLATAVDLGLVSADTVVLPEGHQGCEKIHNDLLPVCTWDRRPQPPMPAKECFQKSDNLCFYHLAEKIPRKDFYEHLRAFGVGSPSGIDLKEESFGFLKSYDTWNIGDVSAFSYGHGYLMNVVQAINASSTIANYGVRMQPKIIDKIVSPDGDVTTYNPTVMNQAISRESAESIVDMMRNNFRSSIPEWVYWDLGNYDIGVKSGTALIANSTGYSTNINATFVGFDSSADRTFVMLVKLENPKIPDYDRLAFYNVRPLWLDIFKEVKDIIGVPRK